VVIYASVGVASAALINRGGHMIAFESWKLNDAE